MQKKLLFHSFLDLSLAIFLANLLALPFLIFTICGLPASNEIRIGVRNFPDGDEILRNWYRDKNIEPVEITREESILKINYKANLSDDWKAPDQIELEQMGYASSGTFVFAKNPYSDIFLNINRDTTVSSVLERLPIDAGRLLIVLILTTQSGFLIISWWRRRSISQDDTKKISTAKAILLGFLAGVALFGVSVIHDQVIHFIFGAAADTFGIWSAIRKLSLSEKIIIILLGSMLAPFCEELFFRGVIFARYLKAGFPIFGVIFSSVIFASIHFDLINTFAYLLFGAILAALYWKTKSLAACVVAHGINNAIALTLLICL